MRQESQDVITGEIARRTANWVRNVSVLWEHRVQLLRVSGFSALFSIIIVLLIPNQYESTARIMPPETSGTSTALLAALAGRGTSEFGGLGSLAAGLLGVRTSGPLFVDLLRSGTISEQLINQFKLQRVYRKRYRIDTVKKLARRTSIVEDKKSGVISISVEDSDPRRARDLVQAYLDELNSLLNKTNTSSARQERIFIEHRLQGAEADLERAQKELGEFSSTHGTIDIREQTRATVDAAAKLQAQLIVDQSEFDSLSQIYGDDNIRVRAARARIAELHSQLRAISGTSAPLPDPGSETQDTSLTLNNGGAEYPPLRQIPRLAVPYADNYRHVRVQEAVYDMLIQQYELARIQEAKDVPVIRVIDAPGIPEKKSFPPRTLLALLVFFLTLFAACAFVLIRDNWTSLDEEDQRKVLLHRITTDLEAYNHRLKPRRSPRDEHHHS